MGLRIVSGESRGRRLLTPEGKSVRPTSDRVREAVFNSLGSMDLISNANVLDLFAGTGALGLEALSRGAAHVTFVDNSAGAIRVITENLRACGYSDSATVVRSDALRFLSGTPGHFDLGLLDPPYEFAAWSELFALLDAAAVVVESDRELDPEDVTAPDWSEEQMEFLRVRRYGGTVVTIAVSNCRDERGVDTTEGPK